MFSGGRKRLGSKTPLLGPKWPKFPHYRLTINIGIHRSTIGGFIPDVCDALFSSLKDRYMNTPDSKGDWDKIAKDFGEMWNYPNCVGALDGKHINLKCPPNSGSYFFNYKGLFSILLLALLDANYMFCYIDVGCNGRVSVGGVYRNSTLSTALSVNSLNVPAEQPPQGYDVPLPYVVVADDAFPQILHDETVCTARLIEGTSHLQL